jgi:hypothetical protein
MERLSLKTEKPIYNSFLPYIEESLIDKYNAIFYLLHKLSNHGSIFSYFENLKGFFTKENPLFRYKNLFYIIHLIKQNHPDLPLPWRKEIRKIENWISDHLLITKANFLKKDVKRLKETECFCLDDPNIESFKIEHVKNSYLVAEKEPEKSSHDYTLTGKVERVLITKPISLRLETNLQSASEIIQYVHTRIKHSSNHLVRSPLLSKIRNDSLKNKKLERLDKEIYTLFLKTQMCIALGYTRYYNRHFLKVLEISQLGNCCEMTLIGLRYAKEKNISSDVQLFTIKNGDHFFLVIDYSTESDAVLCDPWSGTYAPIKELNSLLDYIKFDTTRLCPVVKFAPFSDIESIYSKDPFFLIHFDQSLIEEGNILAVSEFLSLNKSYINDIGIYNEFLQTAFDYLHPEIILLLLNQGDPKKIYPVLKKEILFYAIESLLNKKNKTKTNIEIIFKIQKELIITLALKLTRTQKIANNYLSLVKKNLA